nr:MAG: ORF1 [Torque teno midi virus]
MPPYRRFRFRRYYSGFRRRPRYFRPRYRRRFRKPVFRRHRRYQRRRRRVRKKVKTLTQWQPPFTKKCKIKGQLPTIICGAGRQQYNYTQHIDEVVPAKMAGGGSFAVFVLNLGFFYQEHQHWRNIWTASNNNYDLVKYYGIKLKIFRPATVDLIVTIQRAYPMSTNSGTHPSCHPQRQLLQYKKIIIEGLHRKPHGKKYKKVWIKPPYLFLNRWFFMKDFTNTNLCLIKAATADLSRPFCTQNGDNNCAGFNALNTNIFQNISWQNKITTYLVNPDGKLYGWNTKWQLLNPSEPYGDKNPFWSPYLKGTKPVRLLKKNESIATETQQHQTVGTDVTGQLIVYCRYNPIPDEGDENIAYLKGMFTVNSLEPSLNLQFALQGLPLWLLLFGYFDWMTKLHKTYDLYNNYQIIIQSPYITSIPKLTFKQPGNNELKYPAVIPLSPHFINGKGQYDTDAFPLDLQSWYPKLTMQSTAINNIVTTGPFMPNPTKDYSWCAQINYTAVFQWGGTTHPSQEIDDPTSKPTYPTPSTVLKGIQIHNPRKVREFHPWDYRRGKLTERALKRMLKESETDSDSTSISETPKKKKRSLSDPKPSPQEIQDYQSTSSSDTESSSTSEEETPQVQQQLQQQQQRRKQLKLFLYRRLKEIIQKQRALSVLTGPME